MTETLRTETLRTETLRIAHCGVRDYNLRRRRLNVPTRLDFAILDRSVNPMGKEVCHEPTRQTWNVEGGGCDGSLLRGGKPRSCPGDRIAAMMLLPFALIHREAQFRILDRKTLPWLSGHRPVLALHFATWITSLGMTAVASSTIPVTAHPLLVGAVSILFLKESGKWTAIGVSVGFTGVVFISLLSLQDGSWDGNLLALIGGVFAGIYILAAGSCARRST